MIGLLAPALWSAAFAQAPAADNATVPGPLRTYSTVHSIGIEWDVTGDANHNARCRVEYRVKGTAAFKAVLPLFRVDFHGWYAKTRADRAYNMLAGSILFLEPDTEYEVKLELSDADGGSTARTEVIRTQRIPVAAAGGRTLHVVPGDGGGDGSAGDPLRGIKAADAAAEPGDVLVLGAGEYPHAVFAASGTVERTVTWRPARQGAVVLRSCEVAGSHVRLEGLNFRPDGRATALKAVGGPAGCAVAGCDFAGFHNSIVLSRESRGWYIADNVVVGDNDPAKSTLDGEGIDLYLSEGHTVAHNRVSRVESGVHYPKRNCDIFGNDIFDTTDDGLEPDYGYANIRMWGNRIVNYRNNGISFQPQYCGPWYILRNVVVGPGYTFKFRVQDRFVSAHNVFVTWGSNSDRMHHLLTSLSRNNLYIRAGKGRGAPLWNSIRYKDETVEFVRPVDLKPNWMTDVDYDGFDFGDSPAFSWLGQHRDLESFARAVGIEKNAIRLRKEDTFERWTIPAEPGAFDRPVLTLKAGSAAIDAGAVLPGINDDFAGKAPDLGPHEFGRPAPQYGPRK